MLENNPTNQDAITLAQLYASGLISYVELTDIEATSTNRDWRECRECGDDIHIERWALGYRLCLFCGEDAATVERASWCVVMEYGKGNYQYVTPESAYKVLKDTNQKNTRGEGA